MSLGRPSAIFCPISMTATQSEMPMTTCMSCSMSSSVNPLRDQGLQQDHQVLAFPVVESRGGLVQNQKVGSGRECAGDLQVALLAIRQVLGQFVAVFPQTYLVKAVSSRRDDVAFLTDFADRMHNGGPCPGPRMTMGAGHDVLDTGQRREKPDVLEGAGDAIADNGVGLEARDIASQEVDLPRCRLVDARDHVEQRRLASAVGPDERGDLAGPHVQVEVVHCGQPTELQGSAVRLK